ncbi:MAG: flagellar protein FlaG [Syntrophomonadaceae bacterium]|jgi:flagellar protein FlaG
MRIEGQWFPTEFNAGNLNSQLARVTNGKEGGSVNTKIGSEITTKQLNIDEENIRSSADLLNQAMKISNYHLQFKVHKESGRIQVKVINSETQEVIREIPPEKILECSAMIKRKLEELAGILLDKKI